MTDLEMRCAAMASERGAVMLPSATVAGHYTLTDARNGSIINADATLSDVKAFCSQIDASIAT